MQIDLSQSVHTKAKNARLVKLWIRNTEMQTALIHDRPVKWAVPYSLWCLAAFDHRQMWNEFVFV